MPASPSSMIARCVFHAGCIRRTRRTGRYSDTERIHVQEAASQSGITSSALLGSTLMSAIGGVPQTANAGLSLVLVEIIKLTHHSAYILSTLKRDK